MGSRALLVVLLFVMGACTSTDPAPSGGSLPSESPSPSPALPPGVEPTARGPLKPGTYQTSVFEPAATFTVGRGWQIPFEGKDNIVIAQELEPRDEVIYLDSSQSALDAADALEYAQDVFSGTTGVARHFRFSDETTVSIGDFRGRGVTMNVRTNAVTLGLGAEAYEVRPGDRLHLNAINVNGDAILVFVEAPGAKFDAFVKEAKAVLASFEF
jgi:hypothetical protein